MSSVPFVKCLRGGLRDVPVLAPCVQAVVDGEVGEDLQCGRHCGRRDLVERRMAEHFVGDPHGLLFYDLDLAVLLHDFPPPVDLLMYVDLDWTHIRAAAIEGRGEGQLAVLSNLKGRHHDDADWP